MEQHSEDIRRIVGHALAEQPVEHAFLLGYLDDAYAQHMRWFVDHRDGKIRGLVAIYDGLRVPGMFTFGEADAVAQLLESALESLEDTCTGHVPPAHLDVVLPFFRTKPQRKQMTRMGLRRSNYTAQAVAPDIQVVRLDHTDIGAILQLYAHWPDNFFEPFHLESKLHFGIRDETGALVSIAGVHALSPKWDVASIGNLITHPNARGKGYARACSARLIEQVFQRVQHVTLDVEHDNEAVIRTYARFGFRPHADYFELRLLR